MRIRSLFQLLALSAAGLSLPACSPYFFRTPQLLHPGPAGYQRYNATIHDPYPLPDVGPEIVGGRPREYATPVSEVDRSYDAVDVGPRRATTAIPAPIYAPLAPVFTPPAPVVTPSATPLY